MRQQNYRRTNRKYLCEIIEHSSQDIGTSKSLSTTPSKWRELGNDVWKKAQGSWRNLELAFPGRPLNVLISENRIPITPVILFYNVF